MIRLSPASSSKTSNLAFALFWLPGQRRRDALVFFRFCRTVDDIADEGALPPDDRARMLDEWLAAIRDDRLPPELAAVVGRYGIAPDLLAEIVRGCATDVRPARFATAADLEKYCWRVACAVGIASIKIFGCEDPASEQYAVNLGHALQLTNILRDIGEDAAAGRIYLPSDDMVRFGVNERELLQGKPGDGFRELMAFEATRARERFRAAIPPARDRRTLLAAEIMKAIYMEILGRLENSGFAGFGPKVRLGKPGKLFLALGVCVRGRA